MSSRFSARCIAVTLALAPIAAHAADLDASSRLEKPQEIVGDSAITARIKADLAREKDVNATGINVDTKNGVVTLSGTARNRQEIDKAGAIAKRASGVASVRNEIRVK